MSRRVAGGLLMIVVAAFSGHASTEERKVANLSERTFQQLSSAQQYIDREDFSGALNILDGYLLSNKGLNPHERGQIQNMRGFAHFSLKDYAEAIDAYEQVIEAPVGVPVGLETTTVYTLAQLNFVQEKYANALDYMNRWRSMIPDPGIESDMFLTQVTFQMGELDETRRLLFATLDRALAEGKPFKLTWLTLADYLSGYMDAGLHSDEWAQYLEDNRPFAALRPEYPEHARKKGIEGSVQIEFVLTKSGDVVDPVGEGVPFGVFEQAAAKAFSEATFEPFAWRGQPIDTEVSGTIRFELDD